MNISRSVTAAFVLTGVLGLPTVVGWSQNQTQAVSGAQYDLDALFFQAFMAISAAEKLEAAKNYSGAFFKFKEASQIYDSIARVDPKWRSDIVNYRRISTRKKIDEMRLLEKDRRATQAVKPTPSAPPRPSGAAELLPPVPPSDTSSNDILPPLPTQENYSTRPNPTPPATIYATPAAASPVDSRLQQYQAEIGRLQLENQKAQQQMQAKENDLFELRQQLDRNRKDLNEALKKQLDLQGKVDTADKRSGREIATYKEKLETANKALAQATKVQEETNQKMNALLDELKTARESIKALEKEKEQLVTERTQMKALMEAKDNSATDALIEENRRLKAELDKAQAKVATLTLDKETAVKEATALREQLSKLRDEVERTRKENQDYRAQIADLRTKLEETADKLAELSPNEKEDPELVEENKLLRRMLTDQLKHQAYREQKKRLALEQLARLQINSEELLSTINEIATPPATLSAEERDLLQDPQMQQFLTGQSIGTTIVARPDDPANAPTPELTTSPPDRTPPESNSDVPPAVTESKNNEVANAPAATSAEVRNDPHGNFTAEMKILADAGEAAFTQSKYWEAERSFVSLVKEDPANVYGLSRLAAAQLAQRKYAEAEKSLKKATAFSSGDPFIYYLLGFSAYQQNKLDDAQKFLDLSVQLKNDYAKAHFTLGCLANRKENIEVARDSFKRAVEIDPNYTDAHMNLAIILANDGLSEDARKHYDLAIAQGAKRDPKIEKVLGVN